MVSINCILSPRISLLNGNLLYKELKNESLPLFYMLLRLDVSDLHTSVPNSEVKNTLSEFKHVFRKDLLNSLPPIKEMHHVIDLQQGSALPNLPHYRLSPQRT